MRHAGPVLALLMLVAPLGCTGVTMGVGVSRYPGYYYGRGPFWGYGSGVVVVDPCRDGSCGGIDRPDIDYPEAVPLPEPPMVDFPDMGMPDVGGMDMDVGGFDF